MIDYHGIQSKCDSIAQLRGSTNVTNSSMDGTSQWLAGAYRRGGGYIDIYYNILPKSGQVTFYGVKITSQQLLNLVHNEY